MQPVQIMPKVYWVGAIDYQLRYFHGYLTPRGTTYNAYLIVDEEAVTLVDTVKKPFFDQMLERIRQVVDPECIDHLVINHVEMDHAGSIPSLLQVAKNARSFISPRGKKALERYQAAPDKLEAVPTGHELKTGKLTLKFVHTPMVHWPDSMVTYVPERKLLLPNDGFGQHIASPERFVDEVGYDKVLEEALKYYANIVMPYGDQVKGVLDTVRELPIEMIAPSHGLIWRSHIGDIVEEYTKWATHQTEKRALIVYDTMWGSTEKLMYALRQGLEDKGIPTVIRSLQANHISDIMPDVLRSRLILLGTPTLNNGMLPNMGEFLTYVKGLRPKQRIGFAFGSHGWGGQGARQTHEAIEEMGWDAPLPVLATQYLPDAQELEKARATAHQLADML